MILEDELLRYMFNSSPIKKQCPLDQAPKKIFVSSQFVEKYSFILQKFITQNIVEKFKLREFFLEDNGITKKCRVIDRLFWEKAEFRFTQQGLEVFWDLYCQRSPKWLKVNPWDAFLITILQKNMIHHYNYEWLLQNKAHWIVTAYFLLENAPFVNLKAIPWGDFFTYHKEVPYPIRFLLIELVARYYQKLTEELQNKLDDCLNSNWRNYSFEVYDPRSPQFFAWLSETESRYMPNSIEKAYQYWTTQGMTGYDDNEYLHAFELERGLFHNIRKLEKLIKSLGSLRNSVRR